MSTKEDEDNAVSRTKIVATIPWIPAPPPTSKADNITLFKFEDSAFCKKMIGCEGKKNFKFYQMLNQMFPYFLPQRYHTMDSWSVHLKSANGQYWNHASHFLMLNKVPNGEFYDFLQRELQAETPDLSKFVPSYDIMGEVTQLEQCQSAAEFLLEPWVLIQLPLHPVMLHQWTVALMAETLRFQKDITEMLYLPFPSHVSDYLKQLQKILKTLFDATMQLTELVFLWTKPAPHWERSLLDQVKQTKDKLDSILPGLMPILELVMSEKGKMTIKALKKMIWNKNYRLTEHNIKRGGCLQGKPYDLSLQCSIYSWEFWGAASPHCCMFYAKTAEEFANSKSFEERSKESLRESVAGKPPTPHTVDFICQVIDDCIIKSGRLKSGASRVSILKSLDWGDPKVRDSLGFIYSICRLGITSHINSARDENYGAIYNIINLYCDLKFEEEIVSLMTFFASQFYGVSFEPVGCEGVHQKMEMDKVKRVLTSVKPNNKWLHENLLKQVKATCFSPQRQFAPVYSQGPKLIAEHFQERIKNLVYKMIERQSRIMKDSTLNIYPECQTVQYLLPCFVASFLDLEKDQSVSQEEKKKYLNFVHELVKSYEEKEFKQTLCEGWANTSWFTNIQGKLVNWKLCHWVENIRDCLAKEVPNALDAFCGNVLTFMTVDICGSFESSSWKCKEGMSLKPWALQMFMFLCRVNATFEDLGWLDDSKFHAVSFLAIMSSLTEPDFCFQSSAITSEVSKPLHNSNDHSEYCQYLYKCVQQGDVVGAFVQKMNIFLHVLTKRYTQNKKEKEDKVQLLGPAFPVDTTDPIVWNLEQQHWWKLMHQIKGIMAKCTFLKNNSLTVSLEYAQTCGMSYPLQDLTSEGKVKMSHPGEITFFPVEHCRWCGLVEVKEFRVCPECLQNPDYLDVNVFCSEECEKEALDKQHLEEHARFLMEKCGLFN